MAWPLRNVRRARSTGATYTARKEYGAAFLLFFGCFSNVSSPVLRGGKEEEKKL